MVSQAPDERLTGVRFTLGLPNNDFASDSLLEREAADNRLRRGSTPRRSTKITGGLALVKQARTVGSIPIPSTKICSSAAIDHNLCYGTEVMGPCVNPSQTH